ncbi:MAG TPA: 4-hydroxy-3-methylbut-2-enyl diphosphate reductase [Candidatus Polarisedimenticolia bacterium]|nr:4-hydroxy-3-methylbut-2-enyl diphosphate reductase [Candidatus Polarisedimenticolia bacterium]
MTTTYYQRGFGLKEQIQPHLEADYHSRIVEQLRGAGHRLVAGDLTFLLAREFGFCYGVERAVEYAYETRRQFPDRRIFLTGEIIHNPHVNRRLKEMGIEFLRESDGGGPGLDAVGPGDVVILPAFGVTVQEMATLRDRGSVLVDTTCGSVLNVWKNVDRFSASGYTAVIHGKYAHEETRATASRTTRHPGGRYLVVRDLEEARLTCDYILGRGSRAAFLERFAAACSPGFDPDADLARVGLANQTTMLSSESLAIQEMIRASLAERYGAESLAEHFRAFDTICSATQDRQDAVVELLASKPDRMIVIGGYNSSNTTHLAALAARAVPTFHIEDAACIEAGGVIRHRPYGAKAESRADGWLPAGPVIVGLTAGASTPNNKIGEVVAAVARLRGLSLEAPAAP